MYLFQKQAWHSFWAGKHMIQKKRILFGCPHSFPVFEILMTKFSFKLLQTSSTLFDKNIDYNRLACKIAIANLGGPVKRRI